MHSRKRGRYRVPGPPVHDDLVAGVFRAQAPNQVWFTTNVTDGLGNKADASYTSDSNVAKYSTGNASASGQLNYDGLNNLTSAAVQPGAHSTYSYGDSAHPFSPTSISDPQNNTSQLSYDTHGNVATLTDPLASQNLVQLAHDPRGNVASSTDPDGHLTSYGYDANDNLTSITPPTPLGQSRITYDGLSRISTVTDGKGQLTAYIYDALDRATKVSYADGSSVSDVYDADGNPTSMTDSTGTSTMTYDAMGRLIKRVTPDGTTVSYTYDGVGNMLTLTDPGGTTQYGYNETNHATLVTLPAGQRITIGYDANGNQTSVAYPNGVTMYSVYDTANRLVGRHVTLTEPGPTFRGRSTATTPTANSCPCRATQPPSTTRGDSPAPTKTAAACTTWAPATTTPPQADSPNKTPSPTR